MADTGVGIVERGCTVVGAQQPIGGAPHLVKPSVITGGLPRPHRRFGEGACLDGLLVETRPRLTRLPPAHRGEAQPITFRFDLDQPLEQTQPAGDHGVVVEQHPGGDHRRREHTVGVGEALLRPRPGTPPGMGQTEGVMTEKGSKARLARVGLQGLHQPEHAVGVRPRRLPAPRRKLPQKGETPQPERTERGEAGTGSQGPHRPTLTVLRADRVHPPTVETETVVEPPVRPVGVLEEGGVHQRSPRQRRTGSRFPAHRHQGPSGVVGGVATLPARDQAPGVLEDPGVVGESQQMGERGIGVCRHTHRSATTAPATNRSATSQ